VPIVDCNTRVGTHEGLLKRKAESTQRFLGDLSGLGARIEAAGLDEVVGKCLGPEVLLSRGECGEAAREIVGLSPSFQSGDDFRIDGVYSDGLYRGFDRSSGSHRSSDLAAKCCHDLSANGGKHVTEDGIQYSALLPGPANEQSITEAGIEGAGADLFSRPHPT
jgi:hypothetical protein